MMRSRVIPSWVGRRDIEQGASSKAGWQGKEGWHETIVRERARHCVEVFAAGVGAIAFWVLRRAARVPLYRKRT